MGSRGEANYIEAQALPAPVSRRKRNISDKQTINGVRGKWVRYPTSNLPRSIAYGREQNSSYSAQTVSPISHSRRLKTNVQARLYSEEHTSDTQSLEHTSSVQRGHLPRNRLADYVPRRTPQARERCKANIKRTHSLSECALFYFNALICSFSSSTCFSSLLMIFCRSGSFVTSLPFGLSVVQQI